jgi:hypothetical protein
MMGHTPQNNQQIQSFFNEFHTRFDDGLGLLSLKMISPGNSDFPDRMA